MRLIPLTSIDSAKMRIYVQPLSITEVIRTWNAATPRTPGSLGSLVYFGPDYFHTVRETPDEIAALCNAPEASPHV